MSPHLIARRVVIDLVWLAAAIGGLRLAASHLFAHPQSEPFAWLAGTFSMIQLVLFLASIRGLQYKMWVFALVGPFVAAVAAADATTDLKSKGAAGVIILVLFPPISILLGAFLTMIREDATAFLCRRFSDLDAL